MAATSSTAAPPQSRLALLLPILAWIKQQTPCFRVSGDDIEVLSTPTHFYETLKSQILAARHRIVLASLYLGTSPLEQELVECLRQASVAASLEGRSLSISILLDYQRGTRGVNNSCTMLQPLLDTLRHNPRPCVSVDIALYHTPALRGLLKRILPQRVNEVLGLSHIKVYLFDDSIIMSGANLSESYFTNRQDRYIMFRRCSKLADFFAQLVDAVSLYSFQLRGNGSLALPSQIECHPYDNSDNGAKYKEEVRRKVLSLFDLDQYEQYNGPEDTESKGDTWIYPLVQMASFDIRNDEEITTKFLEDLPPKSLVRLASGYFNLTEHYCDTIINKSEADYRILTASPQANGFYGATGLSSRIPDMYTHMAHKFHRRISRQSMTDRISVDEFSRHGWTFHAKGLWCSLPGQQLPSITFIGSPNFGYRSVYRDLEAQILVVTTNTKLQEQLHKEQEQLYSQSQEVTEETFSLPHRRVPLWVRVASYFIHTFF